MRIKKLILKNFRQFENLELDFTDENGKILDVVVFAGVNGSGKSTILNFLSEVFITAIEYKGILREEPEFLVEFELFNTKFEEENKELLDFYREKENENITKNVSFSTLGIKDSTYSNKLREIDISLDHFLTLEGNKIGNQLAFLKNRGEFLHKSGFSGENIDFKATEANILKKIQSIVFKDKHQAPFTVIQNTIDALNNALKILKINTRLTDIESERLVFSNGTKNNLTYEDLSNGEKQLFFQIFTLHNLHLNNGILLIDEPEDAMHPTWQREILNVYKNIGTDNQVFVATHSPHILSSVKPESLFVLNIDEETGKIKAFNMAKERKNTKGLDLACKIKKKVSAKNVTLESQNILT